MKPTKEQLEKLYGLVTTVYTNIEEEDINN